MFYVCELKIWYRKVDRSIFTYVVNLCLIFEWKISINMAVSMPKRFLLSVAKIINYWRHVVGHRTSWRHSMAVIYHNTLCGSLSKNHLVTGDSITITSWRHKTNCCFLINDTAVITGLYQCSIIYFRA